MAIRDYLSKFFRSDDNVRGEMSREDARRIISAYGGVLERSPGPIHDIQMLPFSKDQIKAALMIALRLEPNAMTREHLKTGYLSLANFQVLSEAERTSGKTWEKFQKSEPKGMSDEDLLSVAKSLSTDGGAAIVAHKRGTDEAATLIQELKAAGF